MKNTLLIFILLVIFTSIGTAQNYILIEKNGGKKKFKIHLGKQFKCKTTDGVKHKGQVTKVTDSTIILGNQDLIYARDIKVIILPRKFFLGMTELGLKAGLGYAGISVINRGFSGMDVIVPRTLIISGTSLGVAGISYLASLRHIKLKKRKWKLKLITYVQEEDLLLYSP